MDIVLHVLLTFHLFFKSIIIRTTSSNLSFSAEFTREDQMMTSAI